MYVERCKTFKKHFKEIVKVKFKKMTQKQRDWGKVISLVIVATVLLIGALSSCSPQLYKNNKKINITHVLAVTEMGDTLKIPIEAIRPNVIYNVMGYNYMRPNYYFRPYNSTYDYYPYNLNHGNNIIYSTSKPRPTTPISTGSGSNISNPNLVTPPNPAVNNKKKNN
jgi:hypothetical protein